MLGMLGVVAANRRRSGSPPPDPDIIGSISLSFTVSGALVNLGSFSAPVLTLTSSPANANPPTWDTVMADLQDGDTIALDYTTNGSAPDGINEETHIAEATEENFTWAAFASPFTSGATIKWRERYGRDPGGGMIWSPWSNTLTAVVA